MEVLYWADSISHRCNQRPQCKALGSFSLMQIQSTHNLILLRDVSFELRPGVWLFKNLNVGFGKEKTGLVGKNGTGKTTIIKLITELAKPNSGIVENSARIVYLPQDYQIDLSCSVLETLNTPAEHEALATLAKVGLQYIQLDRIMGSLSGGERTRVVLASLLVQEADFMILDEPTNNLDTEARQAVYNLIERWKGGLLVVSHDRVLLNLMDRTLELSEKGLKEYGGNYDFYTEQKELEEEALQRQLSDMEKEFRKVKKQAQATKERQQKRSSRGKKVAPDLGLPKSILNEMRKSAQQTSGKLKKIHESKIGEASENFKAAKERISPNNRIEVDLSRTDIPAGKLVTEFEEVSFGYGEQVIFKGFNLTVHGPDRLVINGPNGSGKTTLVKLMLGELQPSAGEITLGINCFAYLDQSVVVLDKNKTVLENLEEMSGLDEKAARNWLALFLFPADDVFKKVEVLSGGERMRAALACILAGNTPPQLLVLDEPTNNLDLNSIEQIESALLNYKGALIVISHDKTFLQNIAITREMNL